MQKIKTFIKSETVLLLSFVLAAASAFFVKPSFDYLDYIDFCTLSLLFCLMSVTAGLEQMGMFRLLAGKLLGKVKTVRGLSLTLCLLCFFSSMLITNDVALITFVPFSIIALKLSGKSDRLIFLITLETVAANLGSMLTPIGNPQNLYLFSAYEMSVTDFFSAVLPYALLSLVLVCVSSLFMGRQTIAAPSGESSNKSEITSAPSTRLYVIYAILFLLSLLTVLRVINFVVTLAVSLAALLILDRKVLKRVDYSLLLTFVFLFVFIGNLGALPGVSGFLKKIVSGHEVITGVLASQIFSNVPAAILLSGFTQNAQALLTGVNLGGLGTLIASMASLISFKFIAKENVKARKYLLVFTLVNLIFLALNLCLWLLIN